MKNKLLSIFFMTTTLSVATSSLYATETAKSNEPDKTTISEKSTTPETAPVHVEPAVKAQLDKMHLNNSNAYALDMLRNFNNSTPNQNLIFSPISLQMVLGLLGTAADDETTQQIKQAWHEPSSTTMSMLTKELGQSLTLLKAKKTPSTTTHLTLANGLFINHQFKIAPDYQAAIADYKATIKPVDFTKKQTVFTINHWVNKHTNGSIRSVINKIPNPKDTRLVIVNAISFQGLWPHNKFNLKDTKNIYFNGIKGKKVVKTMKQNKVSHYYEDDNLQATYLPYAGNQYALFVILPKSQEKDALETLFNKLDITYFNAIIENLITAPKDVHYSGTLSLPRFSITYNNENLLDNSQRLLGVKLGYDLATHTGATFNKALVLNTPDEMLILNKLIHKATITVNEKGTKAAATTYAQVVGVTASPPPPKTTEFEMKVNHPFIYGILDDQQQLLFLGTVKTLP